MDWPAPTSTALPLPLALPICFSAFGLLFLSTQVNGCQANDFYCNHNSANILRYTPDLDLLLTLFLRITLHQN